jgi:hypothetical protein
MRAEGLDDDVLKYCAAVAGAASAGRVEEFTDPRRGILAAMEADGIFPDAFTCACAVKSHVNAGNIASSLRSNGANMPCEQPAVRRAGRALFWQLADDAARAGEPFGSPGVFAAEAEPGAAETERKVAEWLGVPDVARVTPGQRKRLVNTYCAEHTLVYNAALATCRAAECETIVAPAVDDGSAADDVAAIVDVLRRMLIDGIRPDKETAEAVRAAVACARSREVARAEAASANSEFGAVTRGADSKRGAPYFSRAAEVDDAEKEALALLSKMTDLHLAAGADLPVAIASGEGVTPSAGKEGGTEGNGKKDEKRWWEL